MKYENVLEIIILLLFCLLFSGFLNRHYVCEVNYSLWDTANISFNITNTTSIYLDKSDTLFLLNKNMGLPYDVNVSCGYIFGKVKLKV
jgi:hypothetical protein